MWKVFFFIIMLQYSLGNKISETPGSGVGEIHKSSAQKREEMMHTALKLEVQEKQNHNYRYKQLKARVTTLNCFIIPESRWEQLVCDRQSSVNWVECELCVHLVCD